MPHTRKKSLEQLLSAGAASELKRTLGPFSLIALGVGAIIGAGIFVRTAAAAGEAAGAGVTISFLIAAIACAFAGLCYAEFAAMIPIAGSAYTYAYATMGELIAWIIGWAMVLEYALGAATVSIAWSEYLNKLIDGRIPYWLCHSPFEVSKAGEAGLINLPALVILTVMTAVLIRGTNASAIVNAIMTILKVAIVLILIALGWQYIRPENYSPYMIPEAISGHSDFFSHGWGGVLKGAAMVFFAFIGFDAVSTAAQEAKNPKRDMPIGILGSLAVCTALYVVFAHVITGVVNWSEFTGQEAPIAYMIESYMSQYAWLEVAVTIAILAGFSSVILVLMMGQSRVFFSMSNDGLLPKAFSQLHPRFATPYKSNLMLLAFVGLFGAFVPGEIAGDLTSIGTLLAFALVCAGILIMRKTAPNAVRPFRTPLVPLVPILGIVTCLVMVGSLDLFTQLCAISWMLVGLDVYLYFGRENSAFHNTEAAHHTFRGQTAVLVAGGLFSLLLAGLTLLNAALHQASGIADKHQATTLFLVVAGIHLALYTWVFVTRPKLS